MDTRCPKILRCVAADKENIPVSPGHNFVLSVEDVQEILPELSSNVKDFEEIFKSDA